MGEKPREEDEREKIKKDIIAMCENFILSFSVEGVGEDFCEGEDVTMVRNVAKLIERGEDVAAYWILHAFSIGQSEILNHVKNQKELSRITSEIAVSPTSKDNLQHRIFDIKEKILDKINSNF